MHGEEGKPGVSLLTLSPTSARNGLRLPSILLVHYRERLPFYAAIM